MNNEQLEDWLCELHNILGEPNEQHKQKNSDCEASTSTIMYTYKDQQKCHPILEQLTPQTNMLLNYFLCNFDNPRLSEPLVAQLLSLYYQFGLARYFVLQLMPTFIHSYLKARAKHWFASSKMLEIFLLAIYNEEILVAGPGTPSMAKRADEIRLPSLKKKAQEQGNITKMVVDPFLFATSPLSPPSAIKIQIHPQSPKTAENLNLGFAKPTIGSQAHLTAASTITTTCAGSTSGTANKQLLRTSIRIGPYPAIEKIIAENRFILLTRLTHSVNQLLPKLASDIVCRGICHSLLYICRSGFSFNESDFRQRVLQEHASNEVFADFSRKSRIRAISSLFLIESINGLTFSLFNGHADIALRALDAIHQRAQFEMMADVLLETNALRHALSDMQTAQLILGEHGERSINGPQCRGQQGNEKKKKVSTGTDEHGVKISGGTLSSSKADGITNIIISHNKYAAS